MLISKTAWSFKVEKKLQLNSDAAANGASGDSTAGSGDSTAGSDDKGWNNAFDCFSYLHHGAYCCACLDKD